MNTFFKKTKRSSLFLFNTVVFAAFVYVASVLPTFLKNEMQSISGTSIAHADTPHYSSDSDGDGATDGGNYGDGSCDSDPGPGYDCDVN